MVIITGPQYEALKKAGADNMKPIVKLFMENVTWLVTGIDETGTLWGFGDLGLDCVEFGTLCHEDELPTLRGRFAYMERDLYWTPKEGANYFEMSTLCGI
jgi:hypothetical protein